MNLKSVRFALLLGLVSLAASAFAKVSNGDQAPGFSLPSAGGETVALSDFAGKYVVLEWINPHCPFVRKFYEAGAMQALQEQAQQKGRRLGDIDQLHDLESSPVCRSGRNPGVHCQKGRRINLALR